MCDNCKVLEWESLFDCLFFDVEVKKKYVDSPVIAMTPYCLRVKDRLEIKDLKQCNETCEGYRKRKFIETPGLKGLSEISKVSPPSIPTPHDAGEALAESTQRLPSGGSGVSDLAVSTSSSGPLPRDSSVAEIREDGSDHIAPAIPTPVDVPAIVPDLEVGIPPYSDSEQAIAQATKIAAQPMQVLGVAAMIFYVFVIIFVLVRFLGPIVGCIADQWSSLSNQGHVRVTIGPPVTVPGSSSNPTGTTKPVQPPIASEDSEHSGHIIGSDVILRADHTIVADPVSTLQEGDPVKILDKWQGENRGEAVATQDVEMETNDGGKMTLPKGKAFHIMNHSASIYDIETRAEGKKVTGSIPKEAAEEISEASWYKVKTENMEVGWVLGKFVQED